MADTSLTSIKETLGRYVDWLPVCPEVEYGLPVPREAMHLSGNAAAPRAEGTLSQA